MPACVWAKGDPLERRFPNEAKSKVADQNHIRSGTGVSSLAHDMPRRLRAWFGVPVAVTRLAIAAFLAIVATLSMPCAAVEVGPMPHGRIARAGDPEDCPDTPAYMVPGPWFGLRKQGVHWWLTTTNVSIDKGKYRSSEPAEYLIELHTPVVTGVVADAAIVRKGGDYAFAFKGATYRWVQMSGDHYALTDGRTMWNNDHVYYRMTGRPAKLVNGSRTAPVCGHGGCHELRWAGDLNRDGQLDLLVWFGEGEDEGWVLWFGRQTRHGLVFEAVARGLFEYNAGFTCDFRKMPEGRHHH